MKLHDLEYFALCISSQNTKVTLLKPNLSEHPVLDVKYELINPQPEVNEQSYLSKII